MNFKKSPDRYDAISMSLHWLFLVLFVGIYASVELRVFFERGSQSREALKSLHFMLGLLMFALVWFRLAMRLKYPAPRIEPAPPKWQELAGKMMHMLLYILMIGMPLVGWLLLSASGKPVPFFGLTLPALMGVNKELADQIKELHELVGTLGYFLIGAHSAAALLHHYIKHDNTLLNMLPRRG